jgi:3-hydroxyacyl-[acyl-carrier-protein] dehydratase
VAQPSSKSAVSAAVDQHGAMDIHEIMKWLPHRPPFLLVDRIRSVVPGENAVGEKYVSVNEPYFAGHFPGLPIMPGVLIVEALAQVACILAFKTRKGFFGEKVYLAGLDATRFRHMVAPGDLLVLEAKIKKQKKHIWLFDCVARVADAVAVESELLAAIEE